MLAIVSDYGDIDFSRRSENLFSRFYARLRDNDKQRWRFEHALPWKTGGAATFAAVAGAFFRRSNFGSRVIFSYSRVLAFGFAFLFEKNVSKTCKLDGALIVNRSNCSIITYVRSSVWTIRCGEIQSKDEGKTRRRMNHHIREAKS